MEERKIMVEVTEEEYEKIKSGILNEHIPTYEEVKKEVLGNMTEEDMRFLFSKDRQLFLSLATEMELITQIVRRTEDKSVPENLKDVVSGRSYFLVSGELKNITRLDYSREGDPVIKTDDVFSWSLKSFE